MKSPENIQSWHAHVYYDEPRLSQATKLCEAARDNLPVVMGRLHQKPVGPHPMWSCQLAFANDEFAEVVVWLNMHRAGLTVFVHPNTGDALVDHRDRAIWLGDSASLELSVFTG
ncbi:MAG: DOPA 4,5-dioxygenase family protein [Burkholderiaceae bacterium]